MLADQAQGKKEAIFKDGEQIGSVTLDYNVYWNEQQDEDPALQNQPKEHNLPIRHDNSILRQPDTAKLPLNFRIISVSS
jgi:uncharacterized membrane protein YebE (DUF533 family)